MKIYVKLKSVGKRRPMLENTLYMLPDEIASLKELLEAIIEQEVSKYNSRGIENMLISFLSEKEILEQSTVGKIGFGRLYSDKKADFEKSLEAAHLGFEDGLFRVVVNDREISEIDAPLNISENDVVTFIRLTFLAGRL